MDEKNKGDGPADKANLFRRLNDAPARESRLKWRKRVYEIIEVGRGEDKISKIVDNFLIVLIVLNLFAFVIETVPSINAEWGWHLWWFNIISVLIFTIEYAARIWSSVEVPFLKRLPMTEARLKFAMRPYLIIDLLAILPFYLSLIIPMDLRFLRVLRLFRFLKIARYSPALATLMRVLFNERRALAGSMLLMIAMLLFSSTGIYYIERFSNTEAFGTIPDAAWWAMATLTTVGYGDVSPITPLGKMFGGVVMILGLGMFALPIAIISTGFAQEMSRRDFVVTWSLISRIPILAELDTKEVEGMMKYLLAHNYAPNMEIIKAGSPGDAMYFIASGEVLLKSNHGDITLKTGEFFGEIAMLENEDYEFPYTTVSNCKLLKLQREDFGVLSGSHPKIGKHIRATAKKRQGWREEARKKEATDKEDD